MALKRPRLLVPINGLSLDETRLRILREHFDIVESASCGDHEAVLESSDEANASHPPHIAEAHRFGSALINELTGEFVRDQKPPERIAWLQQQMIRLLGERIGFDHFEIRLTNPRTRQLELVVAVGLDPLGLGQRIYARPDDNGICGYVASSGRTYLCRDAQGDARYTRGLEGAGSSITVPLQIGPRIIGVVNVESIERDAFSAEDVERLETLAPYVALTLHLLNLLVAERTITRQQATAMLRDEVSARIDAIQHAACTLRDRGDSDAAARALCDHILVSVEAMRSGLNACQAGPGTLLGVDRAMQESGAAGLAGRTILVVDDEPTIVSSIARILHASGCEVITADTGDSALASLTAAEATSTSAVDAVICDVKLPDLSGYEVFRHIRDHFPNLPVILMTGFGYDPHHSIMRASQEGLQSILFKPFKAGQLIEELQRAMNQAAR